MVIRRSSVPPCAWVEPTTNWSQPETVAKSKAATTWRFAVVEQNHSWLWLLNYPQAVQQTETSVLRQKAVYFPAWPEGRRSGKFFNYYFIQNPIRHSDWDLRVKDFFFSKAFVFETQLFTWFMIGAVYRLTVAQKHNLFFHLLNWLLIKVSGNSSSSLFTTLM